MISDHILILKSRSIAHRADQTRSSWSTVGIHTLHRSDHIRSPLRDLDLPRQTHTWLARSARLIINSTSCPPGGACMIYVARLLDTCCPGKVWLVPLLPNIAWHHASKYNIHWCSSTSTDCCYGSRPVRYMQGTVPCWRYNSYSWWPILVPRCCLAACCSELSVAWQ